MNVIEAAEAFMEMAPASEPGSKRLDLLEAVRIYKELF